VCLNYIQAVLSTFIANTLFEFWIATLPLIGVFVLRVEKSSRWTVIRLLCLGYVVFIVGVVRIYYTRRAQQTYDYTWWFHPAWFCAEVETSLSLLCACALPLQSLLSRLKSTSRGQDAHQASVSSEQTYVHNQLHHVANPSDEDEWRTIICDLDLEGIAGDECSYTVAISGPPRRSSTHGAKRYLRAITMNMMGGKNGKERDPPLKPRLDWHIPIQTDITVREEINEVAERKKSFPSVSTIRPSVSQPVDYEAEVGVLEFLGGETVSEMTLPASASPHDGAQESSRTP
jgi:hypothetical protein